MATLTPEGGKHPVTWYRSTTFAAFMVAATAFTCPDIFGALNGMGAGGGASPGVTNAANAIVFGVLAVFSLVAGVICNRITPKWTLLIGTLGYAPYAAGFYVVDRYKQDWLLLFGSVGSGAVFLGYPEENRKGFATSLKLMLQNLGASISGIITLALNVNRNYRGSISNSTYVVLMTNICLGVPFALALPPTHRVQRTDGRKVILKNNLSLSRELQILWRITKQPAIVAIVPLMIYAQWFLSYQWQFNYAYFTVRSRALNSMLFYISGFISSKIRARVGFLIGAILVGASWILGQAVQVHYSKTQPTLDWAERKFGLGCFVFILWGVSDPLVTSYKYWLAGTLTNNVNEATYLAALINALGSVGSTFGFVITKMNFTLVGACAINLALFYISVPGLAWVA
ncbi:hypothetical protein C8A05DRAFT_47580 [Staphylotrichum tortipilum]|uniref:Uncharacterized protein n=1 Tax=Staphylotrichum tortipilum TaxID=2831512 RepID=A0AAN6MBS6_9PEZI|nr:hypothetical protein C8A05DRAFT_47580 [Staphylotrichum longicolle]